MLLNWVNQEDGMKKRMDDSMKVELEKGPVKKNKNKETTQSGGKKTSNIHRQ
jgi:hypothetical protein